MPSPLKRSSILESPLKNLRNSHKKSHNEDCKHHSFKSKKAIKVINDDDYKVDADKNRKSVSEKVHCKMKTDSSSKLKEIIFPSLDKNSKVKQTKTGRSSANKIQTKTLKPTSVNSSKDKDTSLLHEDTSLLRVDTSLLHEDTSLLHEDTSLLHEDTSLLHVDTSLLHVDTSLLHEDGKKKGLI